MSGLQSSSSSSLSPSSGQSAWVDSEGTLHEWYQALIFVGREFLGEFRFDPGAEPLLNYRRSGVAYFCPDCGEIWARLVLTDSDGAQAPLEATRVACEKHPDQWNVAGSLLAGRLSALLPHLPPKALKREFIVHLQKEIGSEDTLPDVR